MNLFRHGQTGQSPYEKERLRIEYILDAYGTWSGACVIEVLQILDRYAPLAIGYLQNGYYLEGSLGGQGEGTPMGVDFPFQDLLDRCSVPIPGQCFLRAGRVLHLTQQGGEDLPEGADGDLGEPLLLGGVYMGGTTEVIHIDI